MTAVNSYGSEMDSAGSANVISTVITAAVGLCGLVAGAIGTAVRFTSSLTASLTSVKEDLTEKINTDLLKLREDMMDERRILMKQYGDTLSAIQEKIRLNESSTQETIRKIEFWNRDNLVSYKEFERTISLVTARIDAGFEKIAAQFDQKKV